ncbi:hypothetical protein [Aestuariibaculum sediminum]|uniref:Uncharacterized protein n=1 Tax=Aestuariibaculum sediminum TaxID=2770637 RepID=A0A8J6UDY5_9FLAO|nr:hypothetical protein [Aestuariibaculum sediminum]MBD0833339.1 hypothetical protein [Aestuariibaculum sediminum]
MEKYKLTNKTLEKNLPYAKGLERELLDADTAQKQNEISRRMLRKLKWENITNLIYLMIGGLITFFFTNILGSASENETLKEIHNLQTEISVLKLGYENSLREQNTIIFELKRKLDSLNTEKRN